MTYDEWKKARVKAAYELYNKNWGVLSIMEAVDAVPLPDNDALVEMLVDVMANGWKFGTHPHDKAECILDALRPWIAAMIEKGRKPDAVNNQKKSFPEDTHYDSNGYCDNPARGF